MSPDDPPDAPGRGPEGKIPPPRMSAREASRRQRQQAATSRRSLPGPRTPSCGRASVTARSCPSSACTRTDLVATFAANRNAIRRALQMLAKDGLVRRHTRTGTTVASSIVTFSAIGVLPLAGVGDLRVVEVDRT